MTKPLITDTCPDCHIPFADCLHRQPRLDAIAAWEAAPPPVEPSAAQPPADTPQVEKPGQGWLDWRLDHPSVPYKFKTHHGNYEPKRDGTWETVAFPNEGQKKAKRMPKTGYYFKPSLAELEEFLKEQLGEKVVPKPVKASTASTDSQSILTELQGKITEEPPKAEPQPTKIEPVSVVADTSPTFEQMLDAHPRGAAIRAKIAKRRHLVEQLWQFTRLFRGNPSAYDLYYQGKHYESIRCDDENKWWMTTKNDDGSVKAKLSRPAPFPKAWERHLRGEKPSLLIIPILPSDSCCFGALDVDRHQDNDTPVDHVALAKKITELRLPLVVTRSKSPKSAHLWLFLKEPDGYPATSIRRLLKHYQNVLQLPGEVEIFPKQDKLDEGKKGSGINLPYFGTERIAFGSTGEELSLDGFLALAAERRLWGAMLVRDLPKETDGEPHAPVQQYAMTARRAREIHTDNLRALRQAKIGEGNRLLNITTFFCARAFAAGVFEETEESIKRQLLDIVTREWTSPHPETGARETIRSGWTSGVIQPLEIREETEAELALAALNKDFFVVHNYGGKCHVAWFETEVHPELKGHVKLGHQDFTNFRNRMLNKTVYTGLNIKGEPVYENLGSWWLEHRSRREYLQVKFAPNQELDPEKFLNLWRGFAYKPIKGDCSLYLDHLKNIICNGNAEYYDYTTKWMARAVQHPEERGHVALVWRGDKGPGKNVAADGFGKLFSPHYMTITNAEHLVGRFNSHLRGKCVLVANEAFYAGNKQHEATLKGLVTDVILPIEQKFVDAEMDVNLLHLIILSNNDWVIPTSDLERRFFMVDVSGARIGDLPYFERLAHQLDHGGEEALLYHLLHEVDLSKFSVRSAPHTAALRSQMAESLTGVDAVWYECLVRGEIPGRINEDGTVTLSGTRLINWASNQRRRDWTGINANKLGFLFGLNPRDTKRQKGMGFTKGKDTLHGNERVNIWTIPPLGHARKLWNEKRFKEEGWDTSETAAWQIGDELWVS